MTFKNLNLVSFASILLACLTACSSGPVKVNVLPKEDGLYYIVAYSSSESDALEAAVRKAEDYCSSKGKEFVLAKESPNSLAEDAQKAADMAKLVIGEVLGKSSSKEKNRRLVYGRSGDELVITIKCIRNS